MLLAMVAYLAAHLAAYVVFVRHQAGLRSEKGIFLYHFASAVFAGLTGAVFAVLEPEGFGLSGLVLAVSLHGIYSVSFLELWSLAQGGYSLSILASVARAKASGTEPDVLALAAIGAAKQGDRLAVLEKLGLVARKDERIALTGRGGWIAFLLHTLRRWVEPDGAREG
jgi:hypothetical protein